MWRHFSHAADIGVHGCGDSAEQAFEEAAAAMTAVITDPENVACRETVTVNCEAPDRELLLVDWLNALIYEMATRRMLFRRFKVQFEGLRLHGTACGEAIDRNRHQPATEVKGATYTALALYESPPGEWHAECVVDV